MSDINVFNIHIPITRSMEKDGKHYVYGYSAIFDSPDSFGTIISKKVVEKSLTRLKQFPALRFMHREPLGQILFDYALDGISTFMDEHGFHILGEVFESCEKEWRMIREGGFGFSYGMLPAKDGIQTKTINGKEYDVFVDGTLYEISVVDTPAHPEAKLNVIERSMNFYGNKLSTSAFPPEGFWAMLLEATHSTHPTRPEREQLPNSEFQRMLEASGKNVQRQIQPTNIVPIDFQYQLPETCSESCPIYRHCGSYPRNVGSPCVKRFEQYKNR